MRMSVNGKRICYGCDRETLSTVTVSYYTVTPITVESVVSYVEHWLCPTCFAEEQRYDTRNDVCYCLQCYQGHPDDCRHRL